MFYKLCKSVKNIRLLFVYKGEIQFLKKGFNNF